MAMDHSEFLDINVIPYSKHYCYNHKINRECPLQLLIFSKYIYIYNDIK